MLFSVNKIPGVVLVLEHVEARVLLNQGRFQMHFLIVVQEAVAAPGRIAVYIADNTLQILPRLSSASKPENNGTCFFVFFIKTHKIN